MKSTDTLIKSADKDSTTVTINMADYITEGNRPVIE